MKFKIKNAKLKILLLFCFLGLMVFSLSGCEAFVRKFTRKPKKDMQAKEELVLVPEEYKGPEMTKEELYRQYFLFWKSWQDELITALSSNSNRKKQLECFQEAIENLHNLKTLLNQAKQKKLEVYIAQMDSLKESVIRDIYGNNVSSYRITAERIKTNIFRNFSYAHAKNDLI